MTHFAFEDLRAGFSVEAEPVLVTADAIVDFASDFDFQPFHVDEARARDTFASGLIASGWHTCALTMRLLADALVLRSTSMGAPGVDEVRWLRMVRPGDRLAATITVRDARESRSRPDRGLVRCVIETRNQAGEPVMSQDFWAMFGRRGVVAEPRRLADRPVIVSAREAAPVPREAAQPYLDDLVPGTTETFPPYQFGRDAILAFARAFDPQPFHVDDEAARASHFGGLCASGWHTAAAWMRQMLVHRGLAGPGGARIGPSPGFHDLKWLKPVYVGDTITFDSTLTETRPSRSRPGWGLAFHHNTGRNQDGEQVFSFEGSVLWERRPGA